MGRARKQSPISTRRSSGNVAAFRRGVAPLLAGPTGAADDAGAGAPVESGESVTIDCFDVRASIMDYRVRFL